MPQADQKQSSEYLRESFLSTMQPRAYARPAAVMMMLVCDCRDETKPCVRYGERVPLNGKSVLGGL